MKKMLCCFLAMVLFIQCTAFGELEAPMQETPEVPVFLNEDDPELLQYIEDDLYANLESDLASDDYVIDDVSAIYMSKDYYEQLEFNTQSNVYFGYSLDELNQQYEDNGYMFTLGEDGRINVKAYETYDESFDFGTVIKNVAVGTGIILVCVTVTVLTHGTGTPKAVQILYAVSASASKGAASLAASGAFLGAVSAAITESNENGDLNSILQAAASNASEGFKWGALSGSVAGGLKQVAGRALANIPTWRESEEAALKLYADGNDSCKQVAFLGKEIVKYTQENATRPDIVRTINGILEAIEVKNYDLLSNLNQLASVTKREVMDRVRELPNGSLQRIVLDVRGRKYTKAFVDGVIDYLQDYCSDVYPKIPIDVIW